jgi:hypothetical protein
MIDYVAPAIVDLGSIADHTFRLPGSGDKLRNPSLDKWGEFGHAAGS